jgi:hypothetical protein
MAKTTIEYRLTFTDAMDPATLQNDRVVYITERRASEMERRGDLAVVEMYAFVGLTLGRPVHIYQGIRERDDDWTCYVSAPEPRFMGKMLPLMPEIPGDLFLVFVNGNGIAYSWRWERPGSPESDQPAEAEARFGREVL